MARKPLQTASGANHAHANTKNNGKLYKAALWRITPEGKIDKTVQAKALFELNPSSWRENKTSNWVGHAIPGQSDPVLQWTSGGARTVSFEALITRDSSHFLEKNDSGSFLGELAGKALNVVGSIASSIAGVDLLAAGTSLTSIFSAAPGEGEELSIAGYLDYYRSLHYPEYAAGGTLVNSAPLVALFVGNTFSNFGAIDTITPDIDIWVVTSVEINITKQLPNLKPMEAKVSFQLTQYTISSISRGHFTGELSSASSASGGFVGSLLSAIGL